MKLTSLCGKVLPQGSQSPNLPSHTPGAVDYGTSGLYFALKAPFQNADRMAPKVHVGTATGQAQHSTGTGHLDLPSLLHDFLKTGHIMPFFKHTLIDLGTISDADCSVVFTKEIAIIYDHQNNPILSDWRDQTGAKLWLISLLPMGDELPTLPNNRSVTSLEAFSAYDLPSVEAFIPYFHAAAGFPVLDTWLQAIKAGNFAMWPGFTHSNATKYCPSVDETILGHLVQTRGKSNGVYRPSLCLMHMVAQA